MLSWAKHLRIFPKMSRIRIYTFNLHVLLTERGSDWLTMWAADYLKEDTVLVSFLVLWWAWHVEQDQVGVTGLLGNRVIELHSRMHPPHVGLVATLNQRC